VGDVGPGGGIVFYDAGTTKSWGRYLEAAPTDYQVNNVRKGVPWGCIGTPTGAIDTAIGTGKANTNTILTKCTTVDIAADVADKYFTSSVAAGQWFLPSRDELNELCKYARNQTTGNTTKQCDEGLGTLRTGFAAATYWSSSDKYNYYAWYQIFGGSNSGYNGGQGDGGKAYFVYTRPVRAF